MVAEPPAIQTRWGHPGTFGSSLGDQVSIFLACWGFSGSCAYNSAMVGVEGAEASTSIPSQLAILVPSFDPSKDDLQVYQQKIQLVLAVWPPGKLSELITRLILNT